MLNFIIYYKGYRYSQLGDIKSKFDAHMEGKLTAKDLTLHQIMLGARFTF